MRRAWWLGGGAVLLVVAAFGAAKVTGQADAPDKKKTPEPALEFTPREVVRPVLAGLPLTLEFSGALVAPRTAVLRAKTAGALVELAVAEGSRVRAGQVLGRIDLSDVDSRVAERAAAVESARAQFLQAERVQASNQRLADQQFISPNALDASRSALDAARGSVETPVAHIDSLRSLAKLGRAWLTRDDAQWAVLKRSTSFSAREVDAAARAADAYEKARAIKSETSPTPPDDGALNVLEGRMVLEFGALLDAIEAGRQEGLGITALEIGPALRRALQREPSKGAKAPAKPDAPQPA